VGKTGVHHDARNVFFMEDSKRLNVKKVCLLVLCVLSLSWTLPAQSWSSGADQHFREGYQASIARKWDQAIALFTNSIEGDPTNPEVYFQRAVAFEMTGRIDDAIADYHKTLQLKPDYYLAMEYLAKLYESKGRYETALALYNKALPLVSDQKWRSMVNWWISEAKKKITSAGEDNETFSGRRNRHSHSRTR